MKKACRWRNCSCEKGTGDAAEKRLQLQTGPSGRALLYHGGVWAGGHTPGEVGEGVPGRCRTNADSFALRSSSGG